MFGDSLWRSLSFNLGEKSHNCDPVPIIISPEGPWYRDVQPRKGKTWRKCLIFAKTTASQGGQFVLLALAWTQSLWSKIAAQSQRCSSCKGWVKKCCVWSKSLWVIHQGWLWRLCALWNLDIGLYGVKEVLVRKSFPSSGVFLMQLVLCLRCPKSLRTFPSFCCLWQKYFASQITCLCLVSK